MQKVVFTICSNNYLAQALVLGNTLYKHNNGWKYVIGLVDKYSDSVSYQSLGFDFVSVEEIGIPDFEQMVNRYDIVELNTAVKPFYFNYFLNSVEEGDIVMYLDPDIMVYDSFFRLEDFLQRYNITLIPHCQSPIPMDNYKPQEEDILNSGIYNLGFLAVVKSEPTIEMINWWAERLAEKAYIDFEKGLFTDQIWQNLVPLYFSQVGIFRNKGYNVAYWNLHERNIVIRENKWYVVDDKESVPLIFFHFSGYNPLNQDRFSKYQNRFDLQDSQALRNLCGRYRSLLLEADYEFYIRNKCWYQQRKEEEKTQARKKRLQEMPIFKRYLRVLILELIRRFNIQLNID